MTLYKHAGFQFGIALILFTLWAAADSWYLLTGFGISQALAVLTAALAGLAVSTVIHEWSHLAGAVVSGSKYRIPKKLGFFVYDFDFDKNSVPQFNVMSLSGQAGSLAAVFALYLFIPMDNAGRMMLVAAAVGSAVYGGLIEWPVIRRSQQSGKPFEELSKINGKVLIRCGRWGVASALGTWLLLAW
jgi:hypothetical protein